MKKHIMIVEDDAHIRMGLVDALQAEGFEVSPCSNGREALPRVRDHQPDLILLDLMLPGKSGYDVCRDLRAAGCRIPIIMLTAKGQEIDKVLGLELGADDYITKPFGLRELLARVHAVLRRSRPEDFTAAPPIPDEVRLGSLTIRPSALRGSRGRKTIEFTDREMKVLLSLHHRIGDAVSRDTLLNEVWGIDYYGTTRTLDQVIVKLRQKIETDPGHPVHLLTVHGVGYRLQ